MALSRRARAVGISITTAAVVGVGTFAAFSAGASGSVAGGHTATFAKTSDWGSGFQAEYTITNSSGSAMHGWTVSFDLPAGETVSSLWNATMTVAGQHVTVTNPAWAADVAPGTSTTFGFVADVAGGTGSGGGSTPAAPTGCRLNGAPCDGGPTRPSAGSATPAVPVSVPSTTASAADPSKPSTTAPATKPVTSKPPTTAPATHSTTPATPPATTSPSTTPVPPAGGGYAFAPYVDTGQRQDLGAIAKAAGTAYVTAAFILSGGGCTPVWNGSADPTFQANLSAGISALRANSGDAIASFGGANGTELAQACTSVPSLEAAYKSVIDAYGFTHIDFDIEGAATTDTASIDRRSQALAALQGQYTAQGKPLSVSLTLPALPQGLTQDGIDIVASASRNGLKLDVVNVMAMDYGSWAAPSPAGNMGAYADLAGQATHDQLKAVYPALSDAALWKMVGITPMIGANDTQGETFTIADAQVVAAFAAQHHIGRVAMWSLTRDGQCSGGAQTWADPSCSSIAQAAYAFAHAFEAFSG